MKGYKTSEVVRCSRKFDELMAEVKTIIDRLNSEKEMLTMQVGNMVSSQTHRVNTEIYSGTFVRRVDAIAEIERFKQDIVREFVDIVVFQKGGAQ